MIQPIILRSPKYDEVSITVPVEAAEIIKTFSGTICSRKGDEYEIKNNIIDLIGGNKEVKNLAHLTNEWNITASVYEDYWRKNAVSWMSGQKFPLKDEKELMRKWLVPKKEGKYLDIGCSTALYSRFLLKNQKDATVVAMDYAMPMLVKAREKILKESLSLYLLRADAHNMPFFKETFDGLVSGGTLNELYDPRKVLYESRRVIKKGGHFFIMHLLTADTWYGRILQEPTRLGGGKYWTLNESNALFAQAGFAVEKQEKKGIVCFTLLRAV